MQQYRDQIRNAVVLPEYMKKTVENVTRQMEKEREDEANQPLFAFATDVHIHQASMSFVSMLRQLSPALGIDKLFCGGDFPWAFGSREECLSDAYITLALMRSLEDCMSLYNIRGNHDLTIRTARGESTGYTAPYSFIANTFNAFTAGERQGPENRLHYFVDDVEKRIRYIVLDTCKMASYEEDWPWGTRYGFSKEQRLWLVEQALRLPDEGEGWAVFAFGHIPCCASLSSYSSTLDELCQILKDFKNHRAGAFGDFTASKADFVAYVCGHNHKDEAAVEDNTLFLSTTSSSHLGDDRWERKGGTASEEAFDLAVLNREKRLLKFIRAGAGGKPGFPLLTFTAANPEGPLPLSISDRKKGSRSCFTRAGTPFYMK